MAMGSASFRPPAADMAATVGSCLERLQGFSPNELCCVLWSLARYVDVRAWATQYRRHSPLFGAFHPEPESSLNLPLSPFILPSKAWVLPPCSGYESAVLAGGLPGAGLLCPRSRKRPLGHRQAEGHTGPAVDEGVGEVAPSKCSHFQMLIS